MKSSSTVASRLAGFDKPTIWSTMTPLAIKTNSVNLGQGFPAWEPPAFFTKHLQNSLKTSTHQYVRAFGSMTYTQAIAQFHKPTFGHIDPENQVLIVAGSVQGLFCAILGLVNPGEEVILFDPAYDCYRPQVQMAGGKSIGIPLIPRKNQSKADLQKKMANGIVSDQDDEWDIDFETFEKSLNSKTKAVIVNSPHNPIGKVFTNDELGRMAEILQKFPQVVVIEDNVYEGITFDDMYNKPLPKMAFQKGMKDRTISVYSAGKIFQATGVRSGWVIASPEHIKACRSVHQYNMYCQYNVIENTITGCLQEISQPGNTYLQEQATKMTKNRNLILNQLMKSPFDFDLWIPKGGYFVLADISKVPVMEKYMVDEQGNKRTKDYVFAYQLVHENKVVCIPISPFYDQKDSYLGEKYVRFAFCKPEEMIMEASRRMCRK